MGLWTRSKVREGSKEGGGQESRLEAGLISVPTPHLSGFPFSLPLVPLSPITNHSTERSPPPRSAPQALDSSIGNRRNALSCRDFLPSGMEVTGGVLQASLTQIGSNKIHSFSLSALFCSRLSLPLCLLWISASQVSETPFLLCLRQDFPRPFTEVADSPPSLGYDHFRAYFVKFQPQFSFVEKHLDPFHALQEREKSHTNKPQEQWAFPPQTPPKHGRLLPSRASGLRGRELPPAQGWASWTLEHRVVLPRNPCACPVHPPQCTAVS